MVSRVNVVSPTALRLPAASVATALTLTEPSPKVASSSLVSVTATGVLPAPVTVLITVTPPLRAKVTTVMAPTSALTLTLPLLVMPSVALLPLSASKASVGAAAAVVSRVKLSVPTALVLPALSVWRTSTFLTPSPVRMKLVPWPVIQVPPSRRYAQAAPSSRPLTLTTPLLVMRSPAAPLSIASCRPGAMAEVSSVKSRVDTSLVLPALSVWRTLTVLGPSSPVMAMVLLLPVIQRPAPLI